MLVNNRIELCVIIIFQTYDFLSLTVSKVVIKRAVFTENE